MAAKIFMDFQWQLRGKVFPSIVSHRREKEWVICVLPNWGYTRGL